MVVEGTEGTSTESTTASAVETPATATEGADPSAPSEAVDGGDAEQAGAVVPPAYQPNLTFRVRDPISGRQVEKKFEDWVAASIKDADTEKKVREFHEKAYGLESVKADRERISQEHTQLKQVVQQYQPVVENVQQLNHFLESGNLPAVFKLLGLQNQDVFKWAYNYANMSPEARQQMEIASKNTMDAFGAQRQSTIAEQQALQQAAEFKSKELGMILRYDTQVSDAAAEFDQHHGQGAFLEQVRRTGDYYWRNGQDIPVEQAVKEVIRLMGRATPAQLQANMQGHIPGQGSVSTQQVAPPQAPAPKPVIPNIQGNGTSPVKRVYRSMDDIKRRRQELEASGE